MYQVTLNSEMLCEVPAEAMKAENHDAVRSTREVIGQERNSSHKSGSLVCHLRISPDLRASSPEATPHYERVRGGGADGGEKHEV